MLIHWRAFWRGFKDGFCMGPLVRLYFTYRAKAKELEK